MEQHKGDGRIFTGRYVNIMFADLLQRICTAMLMALLPLYMVDMGYSKLVAGLTTTIYMLVAVAFRPVAGRLADTRGRYRTLVIGTVVFFIASGFFSLSVPVAVFLGMRGLQGLGFCFIGTALMTMATDIIPRSRMSEGIGYLGLSGTFARAFFPVVALSLKDAFGYETTYLVIFAIAFLDVLAALTLRGRKNERTEITSCAGSAEAPGMGGISEPKTRKGREPLWARLVDRDALKPSAIMVIIMFASSSVMTFVVVYATAKGVGNPGVFFTASAVSVAVARLAVGKISQRFGSAAVLVPGMLLAAVSMLILFWLDSSVVLVVSGVLSGLAAGMVQPELNSLAVLLAREDRRGLANSTFFMAMDLGCAAGAVVLGVVADRAGLSSIFLVGAVLTFLALLLYLLMQARGWLRVPAADPKV